MKNNKIASNKDLEILIDNHPDPMILSDINGKILAINDKLAAIFGKKKEILLELLVLNILMLKLVNKDQR